MAGTVEDLPTRAEAWDAVAHLNLNINSDPTPSGRPRLLSDLVHHYKRQELTEKDQQAEEEEDYNEKFSTREGYESILTQHIVPQWGDWRMDEIERVAFAVEVENWLRKKKTLKGKRMARGSKAKIRNIMSVLFSYAMRHNWVVRNPIAQVRQSAKRREFLLA